MRNASWLISVLSDLQKFCQQNGLNISADAIREAAKAFQHEVADMPCTSDEEIETLTFSAKDQEISPAHRQR